MAVEATAATPTRTLDARSLRVRLVFDPATDREWATKLPVAWRVATIDRSRMTIVEQDADATIYLLAGDGVSGARVGSPWIGVYASNYGQPVTAVVFLHELSHWLGCCFGAGTKGGHYITGTPGIMSDPVCSSCMLFSDRELEEMGISSASKSAP